MNRDGGQEKYLSHTLQHRRRLVESDWEGDLCEIFPDGRLEDRPQRDGGPVVAEGGMSRKGKVEKEDW